MEEARGNSFGVGRLGWMSSTVQQGYSREGRGVSAERLEGLPAVFRRSA